MRHSIDPTGQTLATQPGGHLVKRNHFRDDCREFKNDEIIINNKNYGLKEINHIGLDAKDYRGFWGVASFEGNLGDSYQSNGTDNQLKLTLTNNQKITINFEQITKNQFLNEKEFLINYYRNGKFNYANLAEIIGEKEAYIEYKKHIR